MRLSRLALPTALGADNAGSGLFLPVVLLYVTRVVGLPLATAGTVVALGTMAGLAVPPVAGRLVEWAGPRWVVGAELVQALGALTYLAARGTAAAVVAAVLLAAGQQLFYSSLCALLLGLLVRVPRGRHRDGGITERQAGRLLADWPGWWWPPPLDWLSWHCAGWPATCPPAPSGRSRPCPSRPGR